MVHEVVDEGEFYDLISKKGTLVVVDFSASWCGPCRMIAPAFDALALKYPSVSFLKVMEGSNKELIMSQGVRAFPTFSFYIEGKKVDEVRGANINAVESKVIEHMNSIPKSFEGSGFSLGGGSALSEKDARAARVARLGASSLSSPPPATSSLNKKLLAADMEVDDIVSKNPIDFSVVADHENESDIVMDQSPNPSVPLRKIDEDLLKQLTDDMGFIEGRARRALALSSEPGLEAAISWLTEHQEDHDVDDPLPDYIEPSNAVANSLKCDDCGTLLKDMVAAELHAHKTGHSNFSESTAEIKPLTPEEKAAKVALLKEKLAARRQEREEAEKKDDVSREKSRRTTGKEMRAVKEEMDKQARLRDIELRKKEKLEIQRERERLKAEIEKDRAERRARGGKLAGKLGVEGYQPVGLQNISNNIVTSENQTSTKSEEPASEQIKKSVGLLSRQRVGGEGGMAMKTILQYLTNILNNPEEEKYRSISVENKAFKARVSGCIGGTALLKAVGFTKEESDSGTRLVLHMNSKDVSLIHLAKSELEKAIAQYQP